MKNFRLLEINDIYFISKQIKDINPNFKLYYNNSTKKYEVHNFLEKPSLVVSFDRYPDYQLIEKLYYTNKNNMKKLFEEIENSNKKLELDLQNKILDTSQQQFNEIINFELSNPDKNLNKKQLLKILEKGE